MCKLMAPGKRQQRIKELEPNKQPNIKACQGLSGKDSVIGMPEYLKG